MIVNDDCLNALKTFEDNSIDSIVTDPPYELGFMGKKWDSTGIAYNVELWKECLRVLKPGGHVIAFGGTRTYHRMAVAIEDAGFEIRDSIHWIYGSGFPKSMNVSKAIDKAAGAEREVVGSINRAPFGYEDRPWKHADDAAQSPITAPATDAARQWSGFGTALKPAHEPIVVARKPLTGTVANNVLEYGTGALNIDGCRVGDEGGHKALNTAERKNGDSKEFAGGGAIPINAGRWPANIVFTHSADCEQVGKQDVKSSGFYPAQRGEGQATGFGKGQPDPNGPRPSGNGDGTETVAVWRCVAGCPVAELDGQSGVSKDGVAVNRNGHDPDRQGYNGGWGTAPRPDQGYGGQGGASRFFTVTEWDPTADAPFRYVAKPSKKERNAGLDGLPEVTSRQGMGGAMPVDDKGQERDRFSVTQSNHHPTVKPVALMRWLVRLVTPPNGTVLDPFAGSGTTLIAATLENFNPIGIELTKEYIPIIERRLQWAQCQKNAENNSPKDKKSAKNSTKEATQPANTKKSSQKYPAELFPEDTT